MGGGSSGGGASDKKDNGPGVDTGLSQALRLTINAGRTAEQACIGGQHSLTWLLSERGNAMSAIRRHVYIATGARAVWRAITTAEGLEKWLAEEARIDARAGGRVVLTGTDLDAEHEVVGLIHTWRPTSKLEISWDNIGAAETKGSSVLFQVARDGDETRVSIVHSGGSALDDEGRRAKLDNAWKVALETLQALLDE